MHKKVSPDEAAFVEKLADMVAARVTQRLAEWLAPALGLAPIRQNPFANDPKLAAIWDRLTPERKRPYKPRKHDGIDRTPPDAANFVPSPRPGKAK